MNSIFDYRVRALFSYTGIWVTGIVVLLLERENAYVRFHAAQSVMFFGSVTILSFALQFIPYAYLCSLVMIFSSVVVWIVLMWNVFQGEECRLPLFAVLAEKQLVHSA